MSSNSMFSIDKLIGRENYADWKFCVKAYLEHEDLWGCVEYEWNPAKPDVKLDPAKDKKAKTKLILLVDPINFMHIQDAKTSKEVWQNLEKAFDDNGLMRKVSLLRDLVTTTLDSSKNVEDYVNKIMTTAHKLRNIGFSVDDEWLGTLMLAGLPELYKPMLMALESSGVKISADMVKTKLIQEVPSSELTAFYAKKKTYVKSEKQSSNTKSKGPRCFSCNKYGHLSKNCRAKKKTSNKSNDKDADKSEDKGFVAAFIASSVTTKRDKWYVDSGASMHMTNCSDWMYDVTSPPISAITVANKSPLPVKSIGKVNLMLHGNNENTIQM